MSVFLFSCNAFFIAELMSCMFQPGIFKDWSVNVDPSREVASAELKPCSKD